MRRSVIGMGLVLMLVALTGLACNLGAALQPTATPPPATRQPAPSPTAASPTPASPTPAPPTETPSPEPKVTATEQAKPTERAAATRETPQAVGGMIPMENQAMGVRLSYPEDWTMDDSYAIVLSDSADAATLSGEELPQALVMFVVGGAAEDMQMDAASPEAFLGEMGEDVTYELVGTPTATTINGVPVQLIEFAVTEAEQAGHGKVAVFNDGQWSVVVVVISPAELWDDYQDTVDDILGSVEIFQGTGWETAFPAVEGEYRGDLSDGDEVQDAFVGGDAHSWHFAGREGQYLTVILRPDGEDMDVVLQLLDPDGATLKNLDDGFSGEAEMLANYLLPEDGDYQVVVSEFHAEPGPYALMLALGDEMTAVVPVGADAMGAVYLGEPAEAVLAEGRDHAWTYSAVAGEVIKIVLTPLDAGMDVALSVMAPDGTYLLDQYDEAFSDEAEEVDGLLLEASGEYVIVAEEYWDAAGSYSLQVDPGEPGALSGGAELVEQGVIAYGETREAALPEGKVIHEWTFSGAAGDIVSVSARPVTTDADLLLALVDPAGESLFDMDETGSGEPERILQYELVDTGSFAIRVSEYWEAAADYSISLELE